MELRKAYREWFGILRNPEAGFARFAAKTFEQVLAEYVMLLLLAAVGGGLFVLLKSFVWSAVYAQFFGVEIQYWRLLNYALGGTMAVFFFYLFAGTFLLWVLSMLLAPFQRLPYAGLLRLMLLALAPALLFGWFVPAMPALLAWAVILYVVGLPLARRVHQRQKGTIRERE